MRIRRIKNKGFIKKRLWVPLLCAGLIGVAGFGIGVMAEILLGPPFTISVRMFGSGGGEVSPAGSGRLLVGAIGGSGIAKMEGGDFKIGTGIVGGITPSGIDLSSAHVFPNPYVPAKGHAGLTFSQVTSFATIRIYTIAGELVQELFKNDPTTDRVAWFPVENLRGDPVASGVYIFVIESSDGQIKTGKLMVIK